MKGNIKVILESDRAGERKKLIKHSENEIEM